MLASLLAPFVALVLAAVLGAPLAAGAEELRPGAVETPSAAEVEERVPMGAQLTGRELYDRFLKNRRRLRTVRQEGRILSSDPAGNPQEARFWLYWKARRVLNPRVARPPRTAGARPS